MLSYKTALENIFAEGRIPDGYAGNSAAVKFAIINSQIIVVADCGCFRFQTPDVTDTEEALWLLKNHPSSNATQVLRV